MPSLPAETGRIVSEFSHHSLLILWMGKAYEREHDGSLQVTGDDLVEDLIVLILFMVSV